MTSQDLDAYVAHLFDSAPIVRKLTKDILRAQKKLRKEVGAAAWRTYLRLEALVNHRHDEILRKVINPVARAATLQPRKARRSVTRTLPVRVFLGSRRMPAMAPPRRSC